MGTLKENSLKPINTNFESKSQKEWDLIRQNIEAQLDESWKVFQKSNMKLNYIKGLEDAGFYDVAAIVHQMDVDEFIATVETDEQASFGFIYDPIEWSLKRDALEITWETALEKHERKLKEAGLWNYSNPIDEWMDKRHPSRYSPYKKSKDS